MKVLVTGGAGYIGSHTSVELLNAGHEVICIDNFMNSKFESIKRVEKITGKSVKFYEGDIRDRKILDKIFNKNARKLFNIRPSVKEVTQVVTKHVEKIKNSKPAYVVLGMFGLIGSFLVITKVKNKNKN